MQAEAVKGAPVENPGKPVENPVKIRRRKKTLQERQQEYEAGLRSLSNEHAKRAKRFAEEALVLIRKASEHSKGMPYKDALDKADALLVAASAQVKITPVL